jgi:predicted methyltransferase
MHHQFTESLTMKTLFMYCLLALVVNVAPIYADTTDADADKSAGHLKQALQAQSRSAEDRKLDELRHPDKVLGFLGIRQGMAVFDVFAGGGYYTEILSHVVGPAGKVVHYNNVPWAAFVTEATNKRFADGRLANVDTLVAAPESLAGRAAEFDAAIFIMGMHDIYYSDPENGWVAIDTAKFTSGMFDLLKPGGVLGVIDHNALPGSDPSEVGKSIHRVDPAVIVADLTAAGFVLEASSDLLANPNDDKTTSVFLPVNRYKTDRSLLRFRKPR